MKIVVGLGNPGEKYLFTRHNLGFMLIDAMVTENDTFQNKHKSWICKTVIKEQPVLLVKPKTFINLSGQALKDIVNFYKIPLSDILVIHDDKDQVFGKIKFQKSRGHGGHNGVKNIHQELQSQDYCRLKMGIAPSDSHPDENHDPKIEPSVSSLQDTSQFVLSPFSSRERKQLPDFLELGIKAVLCFIEQGYVTAGNKFNSKGKA